MRIVNIFVLTLDKENETQKVVFPSDATNNGGSWVSSQSIYDFPIPTLFTRKATSPQTTFPLSEMAPNPWVVVRHCSWHFLT